MKIRSLALSAFLLAGVLVGAELVQKILARVNDRLSTNSEFQRRVVAASHAPQASSDPVQIKREVLEDLIKEKLLEERAKEMSVSASEEEIETAVERVKRQYNLATDQEFDAALASSNMTRADLKRQMRQTIILQNVIGRGGPGESRGEDGRGARAARRGNAVRGAREGILRGERPRPRRRPGIGV